MILRTIEALMAAHNGGHADHPFQHPLGFGMLYFATSEMTFMALT